MPKRQFLFSAVFGFRNPTQEIFSELDETKAYGLIFHGVFQNTEEETKRGHEVVIRHRRIDNFLCSMLVL